MKKSNQTYVLLVGIDKYNNPSKVPSLRGCVADVEKTERLLTKRWSIPNENILTLKSSHIEITEPYLQPTRDNILRGWVNHLGQAGDGDQVLFCYSGHGSQSRNPDEEDELDETIVSVDGRTDNVPDILDNELNYLIAQIEKYGAQVSVLMDCCHSGTATRGMIEMNSSPCVRQCPADYSDRPNYRTIVPPDIETVDTDHVLLSACQDHELANEYREPRTMQWHGVVSYFFHQAIEDGLTTWGDIFKRINGMVPLKYANQNPKLTGDPSRQIVKSNRVVFDREAIARQIQSHSYHYDGAYQYRLIDGLNKSLNVTVWECGAKYAYGLGSIPAFIENIDIGNLDNVLDFIYYHKHNRTMLTSVRNIHLDDELIGLDIVVPADVEKITVWREGEAEPIASYH